MRASLSPWLTSLDPRTQNAAGVLAHLVTLVPRLMASLHGGPAPADLSVPNLSALRDMCLAQAQEVAWQKAVMGASPPSLAALLAQS